MNDTTLAVQRMQDYISRHLDEKITMAELARTSMFSPWYSYRIFKEQTGLTPSDYIRRLRLSHSAMKLKSGECRIADIAFGLGFGSVDGYQRAFLREFGCNPGEYARRPVPIALFIPYGVKFRELRKENLTMENVKNVFIQVMHKPERKVIIKRGVNASDYFAYCEEVGCDVWGLLTSMDSLCGEPVCLWLTDVEQPKRNIEKHNRTSRNILNKYAQNHITNDDYAIYQYRRISSAREDIRRYCFTAHFP